MSIPVVKPERYAEQLAAKRDYLETTFAAFQPPALEVFESPPGYYRQRCEFRIQHAENDLYYAMFEVDPENPKNKRVVRLDQYAVASERINQLMPQLRKACLRSDELRRRLFQVEFLTTLSGEALVTLIYHRPLGDEWEREARALEAELGIMVIGRSRKQRIVLTRDHVWERLEVDGRTLHYQQVENSFTQPNAHVCQKMLSWAREVTAGQQQEGLKREGLKKDLVELYCGNGNFTIALADNFRRVLATEISRISVASANLNLEANGVTNAQIGRMSAEEFSLALKGEKAGRRVAEMALQDYDFSTVLVDPPRAGLDAQSCEQLSEYAQIVYISCNPATLAENLTILTTTHRIERFALFDQFPFTDHCECGVLLKRREV
ncbi:tRNA/tmRNA (uracil-C(5))-methyltransferase [Halovibrio variabilis]|uniref:tRNA/tmRNA (uracil-C(5))-methyltransferase n=1 Tax=Halovibrio variabilis TaxID=31910 RepID=A0A511USS9_9GAMM|nr:tRNA (uridine(54)-C5)-methyltransferase TrmA [Halovibrio variabilis]GEN28232.1 tRNA/tmRNA (uracil-C(5))-methyltransferase [Halovibrio variabilis]